MSKKLSITFSILAALALSTPLKGFAADKEKGAAAPATEKAAGDDSAKKADAAGKPVPYRGKVSSVDAGAKTFSIKGKTNERVFSVTDSTKITKDGAPADISAVTAGEDVRGQATKNGDKWDAVSVMVGAKPEGAKEGAKKAKGEAKAK
jgi:hypothetical protein